MDRRNFVQDLLGGLAGCLAGVGLTGCRGKQFAHVLRSDQNDMVGSHTAGAETFNPLIHEAVGSLLGRHAAAPYEQGNLPPDVPPGPKSICFVGVENRSMEDLRDFKDQIYQEIDTQIVHSQVFHPISRRFVDAGLQETRLRPDSLFIPANMQLFTAAMQQMGQPFDYLLFATITSGTTESNQTDYQRDYLLTLELVDIRSGTADKESAKIRKGYHRSRLGSLKNYNPLKKH